MIWARSLGNAAFRVDNKQTCDHLVEASTSTMKYLYGPQAGWIGPLYHFGFSQGNFQTNLVGFTRIGLRFVFPIEQAGHGLFGLITKIVPPRGCLCDAFVILSIILLPGCLRRSRHSI